VPAAAVVTTILFTDIEGSSRLWEREPECMAVALAGHDRLLGGAVAREGGHVVKSTGDGMLATFHDPHAALRAIVAAQLALRDATTTGGLPLRIRAGLHAGVVEDRGGDPFGNAVNRAARVTNAAHGGQVIVTQAVAELVKAALPEGIALIELGNVRLRDLATPERVYQVGHAGLQREFPPLRTLEAIPHNLPQQLTAFVGREREVAAVREVLDGTRLLTLLGIGGVGKTRLSLEVAAQVLPLYTDGAWLVELAPTSDARLVPQVVASVLGVREEPGRPVRDALLAHVRDLSLLLVLDNCEHVIDACAALAGDLLRASARVRILASSRERLNIAGEAVHAVSPLAIPAAGAQTSPEDALGNEAVRFFVERARAVQSAFVLDARTLGPVVEICRRLDGIPLAIELAVARMRALPVGDIAARLDDRFRLLASGDRTALPRQKTLRALIDWSHDLLDEPERVAFRRFAVFAGVFTLDAAEFVAAGGTLDQADVLDLLAALVDKSLVALDAGEQRYAMLETVRQYALEKLEASGEAGEVRDRHLDFHLAMVEQAAAGLAGPERADLLERLDRARENVLAAHAWSLRAGDACERSYRLVYAMRHYWYLRGMMELGQRVTDDSIAAGPAGTASVARGRALWNAGQMNAHMARYREARAQLDEGLAIARRSGDKRMIAGVLEALALATSGLGESGAARVLCEEALAIARELGDSRRIAGASNSLAQLDRLAGRLDAAQPRYEEALAHSRKLGDTQVEAVALLNLAMVAIGRGDATRAAATLREVLDIVAATGSRPATQSALEVAAALAASRGDLQRAAGWYGIAGRHMSETQFRRDPADEAFLAEWMAKARAALGEERFRAAEAAGGAQSYVDALMELRGWLVPLR
jgi:predicted ATPase/class 3 adenylate cyclase